MKFVMVGEPPVKMEAGQLYEYQISILPKIWIRWLTEIRHVREHSYFADEQRFGPYRFWYHEHSFETVDGGVRMIDQVTYDVGYGPFGWVLHKLWVRQQLERIFAYRRQMIEKTFAEKGDA